jgi:four helix bundle protein
MPNREEKYDIYERIFNFIVLVLKLVEKLPNTYSNQVIKGQINRSAPSMGANSEEADGTNSRKDFLHCFTIVRKESKES